MVTINMFSTKPRNILKNNYFKATTLCFAEKQVYTQETLATVIQINAIL